MMQTRSYADGIEGEQRSDRLVTCRRAGMYDDRHTDGTLLSVVDSKSIGLVVADQSGNVFKIQEKQ